MSYRISVVERNLSTFLNANTTAIGAIVINSLKGPERPVLITSGQQLIDLFGSQGQDNSHIYEVLGYLAQNAIFVSSAINQNAMYGGFLVFQNTASSFLQGVQNPDNVFSRQTMIFERESLGFGNPNTISYSIILSSPIESEHINDISIFLERILPDDIIESIEVDSADVEIQYNTENQEVSLTFNGVPGTPAQFIGDIEIPETISIASNEQLSITIDGTTIIIDFPTTITTRNGFIEAINTAFTSAGFPIEPASLNSDNNLVLTGNDNSLNGVITIEDINNDDTIRTTFISSSGNSPLSQTIDPTNPTGLVPTSEQIIYIRYNTGANTQSISHAFLTRSPYDTNRFKLRVNLTHISGTRYRLVLQEQRGSAFFEVDTYEYSLQREMNDQGRSIYINDIFNNNDFLIAKINPDFDITSINPDTVFDDITNMDIGGGSRGDEPENSDYVRSWNYISNNPNIYNPLVFIDPNGESLDSINRMLNDNGSHPYGFGITMIPIDNTADQAIQYRQNTNIDNDKIAFYTNWALIEDRLNNSQLFISNIGEIGGNLASLASSFFSLSPAGTSRGRVIQYRILELENDYNVIEQQNLDNNQINPVMFLGDRFGYIVMGDRTSIQMNVDTSFIGTRRVYNYIQNIIVSDILPNILFENNSPETRSNARLRIESIIDPILAGGFIREALIICDESNNTNAVLNARRFIIDVGIKATPNTQTINFRFTRVSQTQILSEVI